MKMSANIKELMDFRLVPPALGFFRLVGGTKADSAGKGASLVHVQGPAQLKTAVLC